MPMGLCSQCQEQVHLRGPASTEQSTCGRRSSPEGLTGNSSWKEWEGLKSWGNACFVHIPQLSQEGDFCAAAYQVHITVCTAHYTCSKPSHE